MTVPFPFDNTYALLPERFFTRTAPTPVSAPRLIRLNEPLALRLGLDPEWLASAEGVDVLSGRRVPEGADPIATAYAGHQFGGFSPQLGDGRAILLGEVIDRGGARRDIQLKGAGPTPFSRRGDGRAALGPVLREYVVSEAMAALGVPTTRALAAVTTGERVRRETILPGAVLTRVASSHIRVGTFEFFARHGDAEGVQILADYVIARHYPEAAHAERPYRTLLDSIIERQASLIAQWMNIGFIHGVMNTDNMSVSGETIDYGPCAFLDRYDPETAFSAIDTSGRYAYRNQPVIGHWNLTRLAECFLSLLSEDEDTAVAEAMEALAQYATHFAGAYEAGLRRKMGLFTERDEDMDLGRDLLTVMETNGADFTLTFRRLGDAALGPEADSEVRSLFDDPSAFDAWAARWRARLDKEPMDAIERQTAMRSVNPAFIPRNHRIESMIQAAVEENDFGPFEELLTVLANPYEDQPAFAQYADPPQDSERVYQTFCGT